MMSQLVMLVIGTVILFGVSTAQSDYPCHAADCVPGKYCRVAERRCVIMPCAPQVRCTDNFPENRVCRVGFPLLEMLADKEIECSKTRLCPSYTECINGRCCWVGFPSDKPVSTVRPDKAGECPDVTGLIGTCVERCSGDYNCTGSQKCCSNGCSRTCTNPVSKTNIRPGTCKAFASGICSSVTRICINDNDCPSAQKCCNTSCGRTCQNTLESSARQGTCPKPNSVGSCVNRCDFDGNCPKGEKCCKNGCGRSCMTTMEKRSPRPGQCPALRLSSTCFKECTYDSDCSGTMKCCRNGCGALCTAAAQSTISTCPREKNLLFYCYTSSRCMKDTDCHIDETCCLSTTCSRICIFKPLPMAVMPVVSYAGTIFIGGK